MTPAVRAGAVVAGSSLVMGIGAALGFIPGYLATALQAELGLSRAQIGFVVSLYFGCTGLGSMLAGRLTERYGARRVIVADMLIVLAMSLLVVVHRSFAALLAAAVGAGAGYALANVGTNVAIAASVPPRRLTLAMSIKTAGVPGMAALAAAAGPALAARGAWTLMFEAIAAGATVLAAAAFLVFGHDRGRAAGTTATPALPRGFAWFGIAAFLTIGGSQPLYSWLVPYLVQGLGIAAATAGAVASAAAAAGAAGMIANSLQVDRIGANARMPRLQALAIVCLLGVVLVAAGPLGGLPLVALGAGLGIAAQLAVIGVMHAAIVDRAPHAVARATGITMCGYFLGALFAPAGFGLLADLSGGYTWSWIAVAGCMLLALPAWMLAARVPLPAPQAAPAAASCAR